jgi:predicted acylesterase/phospholipase RssA
MNEEQWKPRVIVIGPGGIKGLKTLGFLCPLEDKNFLNSIDTYCGVSVGAIICLLIISGYKIREIIGEATNLDIFSDIEQLTLDVVFQNKGLLSSEPIRKRLIQLILNKFGTVPTLYNLYLQTGKSFVIVTLNATDEECVIMSPFTHPNISCVDATMFSMNIPFIFYQLIHNGKTYVDGALANPYPIDFFDDGETNILGIYMKSSLRKNTLNKGEIIHKIEKEPNLSIPTYSFRIINSLMDQRRYNIIQDSSPKCIHICLDTQKEDPTGYKIDIKDKANMLIEGYNEGVLFRKKIKNNTYTQPTIPPKIKYTYPEKNLIL